MNLYIYDDFLNKSRYNRIISKIEIRLTDLGLNGKIIRLGTIKNIKSLIQQEIRNGVKNIIAVGDNKTANKVVNALIGEKSNDLFINNILFFIIPVGNSNQSIASALGIKKEEEACNILLARRVEQIDLGMVNNYYFLNKAVVSNKNILVNFDEKYKVEINNKSSLNIINLNENNNYNNEKLFPNNGVLAMLVIDKDNNYSYLPVKDIKIIGEGNIVLDNSTEITLPVNIKVIEKKLKVIIGKDRLF